MPSKSEKRNLCVCMHAPCMLLCLSDKLVTYFVTLSDRIIIYLYIYIYKISQTTGQLGLQSF